MIIESFKDSKQEEVKHFNFSYFKTSSTEILKYNKSILAEAENLCLSKGKRHQVRPRQHGDEPQRAFQKELEPQVPHAPQDTQLTGPDLGFLTSSPKLLTLLHVFPRSCISG